MTEQTVKEIIKSFAYGLSAKEISDNEGTCLLYTSNTVRVIVKDQMLAETGRSLLQLEITKGEDTLVTFEQPIEVKRNFVEGDVPESENEAGWIDKFIKGMEEATQRAQDAAKGAEQIKQTLEEKLQNGDFTGPTLSLIHIWTNGGALNKENDSKGTLEAAV